MKMGAGQWSLKQRLMAATAVTIMFQAAAAEAQVAEEPVERLDEIVVTAARRSQSLQNVPMSVDVATGEQLEKIRILDFKDIQILSPGLVLSNSDGRSNTAALRGISFNPDSGASPAVDVFFNEIPVNPQTIFTAIYDVEQIEVLRGPQGSLRGRTSPAGSITMTTRKPNMESVDGYAQATIGDRGGRNIQGGVSLPLIEGKLALRLAGLADRNRINQVRNVTRGDRSRSETESIRSTLVVKPTDNLNIAVTYQYLKARNVQYYQVMGPGNVPLGFDGVSLPFGGGLDVPSGPEATKHDRIAVTDGPQRFSNRSHLVTLAANWDLGDVTLSMLGGYQNSTLTQLRDIDFGNAVPGYQQIQNIRIPYRVGTGELRLASNSDGPFTYSAGLFADRSTNRTSLYQRSNVNFYSPLSPADGHPAFSQMPLDVTSRMLNRNSSKSVFGSARYAFSKRLALEAGLRYSHYSVTQDSLLEIHMGGAPIAIALPSTRKYKALTGGANLTFKITPSTTLYAAFARSFRPGTYAVGVTTPGLGDAILASKPERSNGGEVGVKTELLDRKLSLNLSAFYQKFDGFIDHTDSLTTSAAANGVPDTATAVLNTNGNAVSKGIEVQLAARPLADWDFNVSASYVDAHYTNAALYCNDYNGDGRPDANGVPYVPKGVQVAKCRSNDRIAESPKFNLTVNSEYRFTLGEYQPFVRGILSYRPGFHSEKADYAYKSYTLLNVFLGLRGPAGKWEIAAFAKNVLNQRRVTSASLGTFKATAMNLKTFATEALDSGYRTVNVSAPREFGLTLQSHF